MRSQLNSSVLSIKFWENDSFLVKKKSKVNQSRNTLIVAFGETLFLVNIATSIPPKILATTSSHALIFQVDDFKTQRVFNFAGLLKSFIVCRQLFW